LLTLVNLRLKIETLLEETTSDGRLFHASMYDAIIEKMFVNIP